LSSSLYGASAEYALHSLLIMVGHTEPLSVRDLSRFQELPERFLAKLFTRLKNAGIVNAAEGIRGGFSLARPPESIAVRDVLEAIDPKRSLFECGEIRRHCALFGSKPPAWSIAGTCRIHHFMKEAESVLRDFLMSKSLAELGREFEHKAPEPFLRDTERWFRDSRNERTARPGRSSRPHERKDKRATA
jgi:Rrf2 family protein